MISYIYFIIGKQTYLKSITVESVLGIIPLKSLNQDRRNDTYQIVVKRWYDENYILPRLASSTNIVKQLNSKQFLVLLGKVFLPSSTRMSSPRGFNTNSYKGKNCVKSCDYYLDTFFDNLSSKEVEGKIYKLPPSI